MQEVISYIQKAVLEISNALKFPIQATVKIKFTGDTQLNLMF